MTTHFVPLPRMFPNQATAAHHRVQHAFGRGCGVEQHQGQTFAYRPSHRQDIPDTELTKTATTKEPTP